MKKLNRSLFIILLIEASLLFLQSTQAFFSDTAASTANTFSAALEFSGSSGSSGPTGSSGPIGPTGTANHLVINEVYYDVDTEHTLNNDEGVSEWVEIYNPTLGSVNLNTWSITDNNGSDSLSGSLASGSFLILIATDSASFQSLWTVPAGTNILTITGEIGGSGLSNSGDILNLKDNSVEVDKMSWENNISGFLTGCAASCPGVASGNSLERNPDGLDTDDAADFDNTDPPTPGT